MAPLWFALFLTYLFFGRISQTANLQSSTYVHQQPGFVSANVGGSVTLHCFYKGDAVMFSWYKQKLGQKLRLISTFYRHDQTGSFLQEFKDNNRFKLDTGNGTNHLTISNIDISDSATYYCTGIYSYDIEFGEGITIFVKGSGVNVLTLIDQSASETVQQGGSETLNCIVHNGTCDGEHTVYWFKDSEESHPGLIYTRGGRKDHCERKPCAQTHSCVYNLPMSLSHAGSHCHYCALASCAHILFGEDKKLDSEYKVNFPVLVYLLSGALMFTTILVVFLARAAYKLNKGNSHLSTDSRSSGVPSLNAVDNRDSDNLHYAALKGLKGNRSKQREKTQTECVYSTVRQQELEMFH